MAKFQITGPDGQKYEVTAPEGATEEQVLSYVQQNAGKKSMMGGGPAVAAPEKPLSVRAGEALLELPRQAGLTARYGIEGAMALPAMVADIPGRLYNLGATGLEAAGGPRLPRAPLAANATPAALDLIGLPQPQTPNERVVGDITRTMAGAGGSAFLAGAPAVIPRTSMSFQSPAANLTGAGGDVARAMSSNVGTQVAAAAGAGGAGGAVREAGGGPVAQMVASLFGGLAGGVALPAVGEKALSVGNRVANRFSAAPSPQTVELEIQLALGKQGINYSALSSDVRTALREEVTNALKTGGELNPQTLARLADFRTVGATPTRGTVTLDPVQLTREKNLAKVGANSTDVNLQRLPQIENANNQALIEATNKVGARSAGSRVAGGEALVGVADDWLSAQKQNVDKLYSAARDSQGRSLPLDNTFLTNRAASLLEDNLVSASLPADVRNALNKVARGEMPLTVDIAEQLKTRIGRLQRGSNDGSVRTALGLVRQAIDETPLMSLGQQSGPVGAARPVNPGNLPYIPGSTQVGEDAVAAFTKARTANRQMMQTIESIPALKAAYEGIEPDKFVQQFITGDGKDASVRAVRKFASIVKENPTAWRVAREQVAAFLKKGATGGAPDDVANFSAAGFRKALDTLGPEKLKLFFTPEEVAQIQATSRVANYTMVQPRGSAINNSNSGAMVVANGLDLLDRLAGRVPLVGDTVQGMVRSRQQTTALNTAPTLVNPAAPPPPMTILDIARTKPAPAALGLLLSAPASGQQEDRRGGLLSLP